MNATEILMENKERPPLSAAIEEFETSRGTWVAISRRHITHILEPQDSPELCVITMGFPYNVRYYVKRPYEEVLLWWKYRFGSQPKAIKKRRVNTRTIALQRIEDLRKLGF